MKVAITGASGQVGSELVKLAKARGYQVFASDSAELDITDAAKVSSSLAAARPDLVINAAAYTAVDKAESEAELAAAINAQGPMNLARTCKALNIPLLHISTDYVFDGDKSEPYTELDQTNPTSVYGQTKLDGELAVINNLPQHIVLRVSWVFGAVGNNFVKTMLRLAQTRDELSVVDDQFGAPTSAQCIAKALLDIGEKAFSAKSDSFPWGVYHLPSNPGVTWHGFACEIFRQAKIEGLINKEVVVKPITSAEFPTPVKRPANSKLTTAKLALLGDITECDWKLDLTDVLRQLKVS
ncbi:MAG: dTDP-4-dehydrorhamnose reductase [Hahellaceae bacterium]|nr:dTDP-4-dehydrorhamnose reductase [Hahellaceae bacterium]MCP5211289.1 dTDP-4-dehydrorhamnose reductase [Hahellaceae bacterium]